MIDYLPTFEVPSVLWEFIKWPIVIVLFFYIVFALAVVRQVQLMTDTLEVGFEEPVRILALFHFVFAVGTFVLAIILL